MAKTPEDQVKTAETILVEEAEDDHSAFLSADPAIQQRINDLIEAEAILGLIRYEDNL